MSNKDRKTDTKSQQSNPPRSFTFVHVRSGASNEDVPAGESNIQTINSHIAHVRWRKPLTVSKDRSGQTRTFMPLVGTHLTAGERGRDGSGGSHSTNGRLRFRPVAPRPAKNDSAPMPLMSKDRRSSPSSIDAARRMQTNQSAVDGLGFELVPSTQPDAQIDFLELQPRLVLPLEVSDYEHSLLNFFHGSGSSYKSATCSPMANHHLTQSVVARGALMNRIYVNTRIALADHMISSSRGLPPSQTYYRRLAQAQQLTREVLADSSAPLDDKLAGPCNLWAVDATVSGQKADLSHLKIVYDLIDINGGTDAFRTMRSTQGPPIMQPHTLTTCSVYVPYELDPRAAKTKHIVHCLADNLRAIERWSQHAHKSAGEFRPAPEELTRLRRYLKSVLAECFQDSSIPNPRRANAFYLIFNICFSMTLLQLDGAEAHIFLTAIQEHIPSTCTAPAELSPSVLSYQIYRIRAGWYGCTEAEKFEIECQLGGMLLNAVKAFSSFDFDTKLELCQSLIAIIMDSSSTHQPSQIPYADMLDVLEIDDE